MREGILFVLSGPSGVGKDTVLDEYQRRPDAPERCITATTRAPRPNEVHGRDYHFLSTAEFARLRETGGLLESAQVHGNWYGTPRAWIEERLRQGRDVIVRVDVQGGRSIAALDLPAVTIFLLPPSWEELERRLRGRRTDSDEQIRRRLDDARKELAERNRYGYWVLNDSLSEAVTTLGCIVTAERARAARWRGSEDGRWGIFES